MNEINILIKNWGITTGIIFLIISLILAGFFVIPLQLKQLRVRNGLAILRKLLLAYGLTFSIAEIFLVWFLTNTMIRLFNHGTIASTNSQLIVLFFSTLQLLKSFFGFLMYHLQFTPEQVMYHDKVARMEKKLNPRKFDKK